MTEWWLVINIAVLLCAVAAFVWLALKLEPTDKTKSRTNEPYTKTAEEDVEHIFNDEFRQELRNRGRLYFEKIIRENAMFLQQDLQLTTNQLNEYMKQEITRKLTEEFSKYEQSISDAKQLAVGAIQKTNEAIEEQRKAMSTQLEKEVADEKSRLVNHFETNMGEVVNHYLLTAIGDQIDLSDQLEYILAELETNKQAILEDIKNGS